jgi:hypothetical protein
MAVTNEPAPHTIPWGLEWQQHLARQQNNASLSEVIGDGSTLEGDLTTVEGVVAALVAQIPAIGTLTAFSGTSIDVTGIPSWATFIAIPISVLSTNGTSIPMLQLGISSGIEATGYMGSGGRIIDAGNAATVGTTGVLFAGDWSAAHSASGIIYLVKMDSSTNLWACSITLGFDDADRSSFAGATKALSGTLDRFRITTVGGVNTFDAGSFNYWYA